MTTKQLAEKFNVKVGTIRQNLYLHGHFKGYEPDFLGVYSKNNQYTWSKKSDN